MARLNDLAEELLVEIFKDSNQVCSEEHEYTRVVCDTGSSVPIFARHFGGMSTTFTQPHVRGYEAILAYTGVCTQWQRIIEELDQGSLLEELPKLKDRENDGFGYNMNNFINYALIGGTLNVLSEYGVEMRNTERFYSDEESDIEAAGSSVSDEDDVLEVDDSESSNCEEETFDEDVGMEEEDEEYSLIDEDEDEDEE